MFYILSLLGIFIFLAWMQIFSLEENIPQGNVGCFIKQDNKLLVVKHKKSGKWDIPSGKPKLGENAEQTAIRETFEETGQIVKVNKLLYTYQNDFHIFECSIIKPEPFSILNNNEIAEVKYVSINELTKDNVRFPQVLPFIKNFFNQ